MSWGAEVESDASDGESEVDLECEDEEFTVEDDEAINGQAKFLKGMLPDHESVSVEITEPTTASVYAENFVGGCCFG